jgi:hypothetical protein
VANDRGVTDLRAAHNGVGMEIYYEDQARNIVEVNVSN